MIAIEATSKYLHIVNAVQGQSSITVNHTVSVPLSPHCVRNGYIYNLSELTDAVKKLIYEERIRDQRIFVTIDSTSIKTKEAEVPNESRERVLQFIRHEFGEVLSDEDHLLDYIVHETYKKNKRTYMHCTMFAVPKQLVSQYDELKKELKLRSLRVDILNNVMGKQFEKASGSLTKDSWKPAKEVKDKKKKSGKAGVVKEEPLKEAEPQKKMQGSIKIWAGLYYDRIKLFTNGVDGDLFARTVMLEPPEGAANTDTEKELLVQYINQIKSFVSFLYSITNEPQIETLEIFGEHEMIEQLPGLLTNLVKIKTALLQKPKCIKGVDDEYSRYAGTIGSLLRR